MNIILAPVITEKSESLKSNNVYVFKVSPKANKTQIKNEVEKTFGVKKSRALDIINQLINCDILEYVEDAKYKFKR